MVQCTEMKGWKSSQGIIKLPRLTAETFCVLTELTSLCAFTNYSADKKGPFVLLFLTIPASPSEAASLGGSCLHQLSSQEQLILLSHLPGPHCRMLKDPFCWGWSPRTGALRVDCPTTRCQSKNQLDLWLCRGQCNEQRAVVIFPQQPKLLETKWESLGQSQPNLGLEEKFLIGPSVCCPAQKLQMWITMAYPTTDRGEYNPVAHCRWKEVPREAVWISGSSKVPEGTLYTSWGALPTPSLHSLGEKVIKISVRLTGHPRSD